jgi:RNA polymerase sigma-70 factor (ECF subfamily)
MAYRDATDPQLVALAKRSDGSAFGELVRRYQERTYAQCLKIMRDPEEARDRAQDAFAKAFQALSGFREDSTFSTWLYAIARNACLMRLRKKKLPTVSLRRAITSDDGAVERDVVDPRADSSASVFRRELRDVLERQVGKLNPTNKAVFELRLVHGCSTTETARILGISSQAVKSRLHAARVALRAGLSTYFQSGSRPALGSAHPCGVGQWPAR